MIAANGWEDRVREIPLLHIFGYDWEPGERTQAIEEMWKVLVQRLLLKLSLFFPMTHKVVRVVLVACLSGR